MVGGRDGGAVLMAAFAPGDPATYLHPRPHSVPLYVPVVVLSAGQGRVLVVAPVVGGGSREVWVWEDELQRRAA